ncbi:hypothetical protein ABW19_dt0202322 [Dactylella cylindrospora]|nr:hypothetical protein ABW19_dt0202322 [Dactylella cylindrospora]
MASAISCDIPVIIDGYESARARQRYLIEKMEALDMTLWMTRIPSATKFHYPGKLDRTDDDNMEVEILDIMREIESLQGILDIYEDVEDAIEVEEDEQEERSRIEMLHRGRQPSLAVPIPSGSISRNPSPCSKPAAPITVCPEAVRPFNPFREEFYLGLEEPITEDTEFLSVPGKKSRPISTISNNTLFGDIVEFVKGWNPFELGSADTSRRSSTDSTISINEMISDSSISSEDEDEARSIRKTSQESQKSCGTDITVPLILDNGSLECLATRKSSISSDCPWRDYLEYAVEEEYDICEDMAHEVVIKSHNQDTLGRSLINRTSQDITSQNIIYSERELSLSSLSSISEPQIIQIELPAYADDEDYQAAQDAEEHIRTKLLDSTADLQQLPSLESVLSNLYPSFKPAPDAHLPRCGSSLSMEAVIAKSAKPANTSTLMPPKTLHPMSSVESLTYGLHQPVEILEAKRITIVQARTFSL